MQSSQSFRHSFYREEEPTSPNDLIYDQIYKNASSKNKYSKNPKYKYYNALLSMKQKLSEEQTPVFDCLFNNKQKINQSVAPQHHSAIPSSDLNRGRLPVYHVEKINKMKFKIYKQNNNGGHFIDRLPVTDLSFQIKVRGQSQKHSVQNARPRLEEILSEYRKMNLSQKKPKSRGVETRRTGPVCSDLSNRMMRNTVYKMGVSMYRK